MGVVGAAIKGFGRALMKGKKGIRSSKTGTIKFKPGVGGLKASTKMKESLSEAAATGTKKFGRPHMTKVISEQGVKKGFPGITKAAGDVERKRKKLGIKKDYSGYEKKK